MELTPIIVVRRTALSCIRYVLYEYVTVCAEHATCNTLAVRRTDRLTDKINDCLNPAHVQLNTVMLGSECWWLIHTNVVPKLELIFLSAGYMCTHTVHSRRPLFSYVSCVYKYANQY